MPLTRRCPVCRMVRTQPTGVRPGLGIAPIRFDAPAALGIHRCVVGIGDDDLVTQLLQALCDPRAFGRGLKQDAGLRTRGKHRPKPFPLRVDTLLEHLAGLGDQTKVTLILVHIDANLIQGWSPVCGPDRVHPVWSSRRPRQGDQPLHLIYPLWWDLGY